LDTASTSELIAYACVAASFVFAMGVFVGWRLGYRRAVHNIQID
jgi:hypothetical protein